VTLASRRLRPAVVAALKVHLDRGDAVTATTERPLLDIARGLDLAEVMVEALAVAHGHDTREPPFAVVGGGDQVALPDKVAPSGYLPALGRAFAFRRTGHVVVTVLDEDTARDDGVTTALEVAGAWRLPLVLLIEGDAPDDRHTWESAIRLTTRRIRVEGVDGTSVEEIRDAAGRAIRRARSGDGPSIVEVDASRFRSDAPGGRGTPAGPNVVEGQDPLTACEFIVRKRGIVDDDMVDQMWTTATQQVMEAISAAAAFHAHGSARCGLCARKAAS
jgi:pyruvate dehydrogenase E1 component alpha subunit